MSEPVLLPYDVPRNLDQDAWFLYETTSIPYYELCARLCEEFAHFFNKLVTGHQAHGMPAYQCVEGQRFRKGCHVFVFDEAFKEVGFHTIEIKEAAPYFCNAVLAVGVGDKARNELLVTVQYFFIERKPAAKMSEIGADWKRMTVALRLKAEGGRVLIEQDDRCLGNPNTIDTVADARRRLKQCAQKPS